MDVGKLRERLADLPSNMPVIVQHGALYHVLTGKRFRNQCRGGVDFYFGIITGNRTEKSDMHREAPE